MDRREFCKKIGLGSSALALTGMVSFCSRQKSKNKPNIILMQADDLGWSDLSTNGNKVINTPNIDQLASESVRFENYYVNSVCAPSRSSLLTGRHFLRTGVTHVHGGKDFMALDETTIAEVLQKYGYRTGMWGKWHSGKTSGYFPWQRGFDEAYMADLYEHENSSGLLNGERMEPNDWSTKVLTDFALNFIKKHRDQPFFAYLSFLNCHAPPNAPEKYVEKYSNKEELSEELATIYGMIEFLDHNINKILKAVKNLGLEEDTVIIFMSDNGPAILNDYLTEKDRETRYVNNLRGHKGNLWENGVKSPFYVKWKHKFVPGEINRLVNICDLFPTLLDLAGISTDVLSKPLDGRSVKQYLLGNTSNLSPKLSFNWVQPTWPPTDKPWTPKGFKEEYRPVNSKNREKYLKFEDQLMSVQNEKYKLLKNPGTEPVNLVDGYALYNIEKDPTQKNNIIQQKPEIRKKLESELEKWWKDIRREENSFQMPEFQIGYNDKQESKVLAYGPYRLGDNVKNAAFFLYNCNQDGNFAEYKIRVHKAGQYKIIVNHDSDQASHAKLQFSIDGKSIKGKVTDSERFEVGTIYLDPGQKILRMEILDIPTNSQKAFDRLISYQFVLQ